MKKIKNKTGFSLIELSIVMLLIGILVAGISQGSILRRNMTLNSAKSLTQGSPVNAIPNLIAWFETTLETSFNVHDTIDGANIDNWLDNSPAEDNNATPGTPPTYARYSINDLPSVRFNGIDSFLTFDHSRLIGRYFTIFVVERRSDGATNDLLSLGNGNDFGYATNTTISGAGIAAVAVPAFSGGVSRIITFLSAPIISDTKGIFINGGNGNIAASAAANVLIVNQNAGRIGSDATDFYNGDISEIIIFNRSLDLVERNAVQEYLSAKYKINITPST